jgi:hypothetical protein
MGKDSGSPPTPPDPNVIGQAATRTNQGTALYNTQLNRYGTSSPLGSTSWTSTPGTPTYDDAAYQKALAGWNSTPATISAGFSNPGNSGHAIEGFGFGGTVPNPNRGAMPTRDQFQTGSSAPSYTQSTTLAPAIQQQFDTGNTAKNAALSNALTSVSAPVPQADAALRSKYQDAILSRVNPKQTWQTESMNSDLANQGIDPNSNPAAYQRAMQPLIWQQNDEQNQAFLNAGTEEANQLALANQQRDLPINEAIGLQTGSQIPMPNAQTPQPFGAQPANTEQNYANQYTGLQDIYNQKVGSSNANMAGLYGLGGAGLMALAFSDKRLKTDIRKVGKTEEGTNIYLYRFKGDPKTQMGVMAQELEKTKPEAVYDVNGIKMVDYAEIE